MGFELRTFTIEEPRKIVYLLAEKLLISERAAKRLIDRGRVKVNGETLPQKGARVSGAIEVLNFEPHTAAPLKPVISTPNFAVFDKPSGLLVHPRSLYTDSSLLDSAKTLFGNAANITHRLDRETSGLVIVSRDMSTERIFKTAFERREIKKEYLAVLKGKVEDTTVVDAPLGANENGELKLKTIVSQSGKDACTTFVPLRFFEELNATLVRAVPKTGRLHQIRVHAAHIGHPIAGDPMYGVDNEVTIRYLDKELEDEERVRLTGASRVLLHAYKLEFDLLQKFVVISPFDFENEAPKMMR